jgi:hypothetical protein
VRPERNVCVLAAPERYRRSGGVNEAERADARGQHRYAELLREKRPPRFG